VESEWLIWAVVGTLLGALSGSAFGSGVARRRDVNAIERVPSWRVLPAVALVVLLAAAAVALSRVFVGEGLSWRGIAFACLAVVGALPAGAALAAIRALALHGLSGSAGRQLAGLLKLRRLLTRLLSILGTLVVVLTLVNAAGIGWGSTGRITATAPVFVGVASTILVGLMYIPTASLLRRRCAAYVDEHFDLVDVDRAGLAEAAHERARVEAILGVDRTTLGEIQAGLVIITPVLASAAAALLPEF